MNTIVALPFTEAEAKQLTREEAEMLAGYIANNADSKDVSLPQFYQTAVAALQQCEKFDETKRFTGMAAMINSYAQQAKDKSMLIMARRINARAWRRLGELLLEFPSVGEKRTGGKGRRAVAREAGLTVGVTAKAIHIGHIPLDIFEAAVDSEESVTGRQLTLMRLSDQKRCNARGTDRQILAEYLRNISAFMRNHDPKNLAKCFTKEHAEKFLPEVRAIVTWLRAVERQ
jgi:hypothetical protein